IPTQDPADVEAIRYLKAFYSKFADAKYTDDHQRRPQPEIDRLARIQVSVFTEDAIWDGGAFGISRGREAIYDRLRSGLWKFTMHYFLNPLIEVSGDKAHARWMLWQTGTLAKTDTAVLVSAVTEDDYVRTADGWRMCRMVQTVKFITPFDQAWSVDRNAWTQPSILRRGEC